MFKGSHRSKVKGQRSKVKRSKVKGQTIGLKPLKSKFFHFRTVYTNQEINEYLRYRKVYYIVEKDLKNATQW